MTKPPLWVKTRRGPKLTDLVSENCEMCVDFRCGASQHPLEVVLILMDVRPVAILNRDCGGPLQSIVADYERLPQLAVLAGANASGQRAGIIYGCGAADQHAP